MRRQFRLFALVLVVTMLTACGAAPTASQPAQMTQPTEQTNETPAETQHEQDPVAEQTPDMNDPMNVVRTILNDPQVIFWEDTEMMAGNTGANFGQVAVKQLSENGEYYQFISDDDGAYMIGNVNFLDQGDFRGNAQAILIKFKPENVEPLCFTLYGNGEVILEFKNGQPYLNHVSDNYRAPYSDYMPTNLTLQNDKWYWALMAFNSQGYYRSLVWEDGNAGNKAYCAENMGDWHGDYKDSNWHLTISFGANQTLDIQEYNIMDFDSYVGDELQNEGEQQQSVGEQPFWAVRIGDFDAMSDGLRGNVNESDIELDGTPYKGYSVEALLNFANISGVSGATISFEDGSTQDISALGDAYIVFMKNREYLEKPLLSYEGTLFEVPVMEIIPN